MMRKLLFLITVLFLFSCNVNKPAEFKGVENIHIDSAKGGELTVMADAKFHNPNHLGGKVKAVNIDVLIDENKVAVMESTGDFSIPKRDEFTIPLRATIPWEELSKGKGLFNSVLNVLQEKEIELMMQGNMTLDFKAFDYQYKVEEKKMVTF